MACILDSLKGIYEFEGVEYADPMDKTYQQIFEMPHRNYKFKYAGYVGYITYTKGESSIALNFYGQGKEVPEAIKNNTNSLISSVVLTINSSCSNVTSQSMSPAAGPPYASLQSAHY